MKGYVIMARENYPGAQIKEICRCNGNAKDIRNALADYTVTGALGGTIFKYNHVEILTISKEARAQMKSPRKNIRCIPASEEPRTIANLQAIFTQIDAMRAADGEQAQAAAQSDPAGTAGDPAIAAPKDPAPRT